MENFDLNREVAADVRDSEMFAEADAREELDELDNRECSDEDLENFAPDFEGQGWADGDHDSAMTSAGWGTDEDYGYYGDDMGG